MVEGAGFEPAKPVRAAILQTAPINHSGTPPDAIAGNQKPSPRGDSNPPTYRLQVGCAAIAPLGHFLLLRRLIIIGTGEIKSQACMSVDTRRLNLTKPAEQV